MTRSPGHETFLSRWSRRKHAAVREPVAATPAAQDVGQPPAAGRPATPVPGSLPAPSPAPLPPSAPAAALPPVESLTFDSDFAAFLRPGVDPQVRQSALRTLLRDPHFNVMDGLDVYIDDYTKPSPLDASAVAGMVQARYIFAPPPTRVNADGVVEDVPEGEAATDAAAADDVPGDAADDVRHDVAADARDNLADEPALPTATVAAASGDYDRAMGTDVDTGDRR